MRSTILPRSAHEKHDSQNDHYFATAGNLFSEQPSVDELLVADSSQAVCGVNVGELIDDTLKLLSHEFQGRQIQVKTENKATRSALIDRQEMQQVLINLVSNAIAAVERDPQISIEVDDQSDGLISLRVKDNGQGIAAEHLPRVFDPFFTTGKEQGTGLGLSVSYGIVRRYRGDISVSSVPGEGSRFTVTLPSA